MDQIISKSISEEVFQVFRNDLDGTKFSFRKKITDKQELGRKVLQFSQNFSISSIYFNSYQNEHSSRDIIACLGSRNDLVLNDCQGAFEKIRKFVDDQKGNWISVSLSYDLKNDVEDLNSTNEDEIGFPEAVLFVPEIFVRISESEIYIQGENAEKIWADINKVSLKDLSSSTLSEDDFISKPDKAEYINHVKKLLDEISVGNIYEINYCRELLANLAIDPLASTELLNEQSPSPFFTYFNFRQNYLLCASPERFLLKNDNKLVSQPIKGTRKRSLDKVEDEELKRELYEDKKERGENVMIVDLVRNDLSHLAASASVNVSELFGIYTFPHVHQMISTIEAKLKEDAHFVDAIKYCFPMGSMTGAPKLRAMKLIEEHEYFKRGLFSGSLGLISPSQNFDLNVVIRSIFYNSDDKKVSVKTGSAITSLCDPEKEWDECVLKANAMIKSIVRTST